MGNLLTLSEMEPYIMGRTFSGEAKSVNEIKNRAVLDEFLEHVKESLTAKTNLETCDHWADFYKVEPDFTEWVPSKYRADVFYSAKIGCFVPMVPAQCVYLLKVAYDKYKSPNMIFKQLPESVISTFFRKNYLGGSLSLHDVVCTFCTPMYNPLCDRRMKNRCDGFVEIYVRTEDMVALVPNTIADKINDDCIDDLKVGEDGLEVQGMYLKRMAGFSGEVNSTYDLRGLI